MNTLSPGLRIAALLAFCCLSLPALAGPRPVGPIDPTLPAQPPSSPSRPWMPSSDIPMIESQLGFMIESPLLFFNNTGVLDYNAATGLIQINAVPLAIRTNLIDPPILVLPAADNRYITIGAVLDTAGNLVSGVPGNDLEIVGEVTLNGITYSGVLLTGEVNGYMGENSASTSDFHSFRFATTGGLLMDLYGVDVGIELTSEMSNFTGAYNVDFSGEAKGNVGVVECTGTIGDFVWLDLNGNGIQDDGEDGIPNVGIVLRDAAGTVIAMTVTDSTGFYQFSGLCAGDYEVTVEIPPPGLVPTEMGAPGSNDETDSNDPAGTVVSLPDNGSDDPNTDFGYVEPQPASLGDYVWNDLNMDGVQDSGEPPIEGVMINLYDCAGNFIGTTSTNSDGFYEFTGLDAGCYQVEFILPPGFVFSPQDQTSDGLDSDPDTTTGLTGPIDLGPGENDPNIDAGMFVPPSGQLGDRFWEDLNGNGIQDPGEPGIPGVTVNLYDCSGNLLDTTTTGVNGGYLFDELPAGCYVIEFIPPQDCVLTQQSVGMDDTVDSDADTTTGQTGPIDLADMESDLSWDAGCYYPAGLGDFVWNDLDQDGIQDPGEPGIEGLTVVLLDAAMVPTGMTTTTGPNGEYDFTGLAPGSYFVQFTSPEGFVFTLQDVPPDDAEDSDANGTGKSDKIDLESGEFDPTIDAGVFVPNAPAITIEKSTNGEDADNPTGPLVPTGDPVLWEYVVTNSGNVTLTGIVVTDSQGVAVSCPQTMLEPGASMTCTGNGISDADPDQYMNIGDTCGTDPAGTQVCDDDPSHYFRADPAIDIEKATNGEDADTPTGPFITPGASVTWAYRVENIGNVTLSNVTVTDNQGVTVTCPLTTLEPDQVMTCTADGTAVVGQYANLGSVVGTPPAGAGDPVGDDDPSHYFGALPAIDIEKATNGFDADDPTGPFVAPGDPVSWTYVVTNDGNVPLTNITVTDDQGVAVSCPVSELAPGDSMTCSASGLADAGQYANLGSVVGTPPAGLPPVSDQDPSHYFGAAPSIDIEKATNGEDADDPTGPFIEAGGAVTWTYLVTNTGNVPLTSVTVTDNQGVAVTCPQTTLAVSESMTCTATGTAAAGQYANLGSVIGTPPVGGPVTDQDPSHYFGETPAIDIEKLTNGIDADDPNAGDAPQILPGDPVTWTYIVTNTGNVTLTGITVTDDRGVGVDCMGQTALEPGQSFTCTAMGIAEELTFAGEVTPGLCGTRPNQPLYENTGTANGMSPLGALVQDNDVSHYCNPEVCALEVNKTCMIPMPPVSNFTCDKPIDSLTMIYNMGQPIRIKAWKGNVGSTLLADIDDIQPGGEVTVTGYAGSPNDVIWEVFAAGTSTKLGESKFHLSCSDNAMNGPEDCGLPQGDGKSNESSLLNIWLLEGMVDASGTLDCTPPATTGVSECEFQAFPASCETGNADVLTFQYTGGGCAASDNNHPDHVCSGATDSGSAATFTDDDNNSVTLQPGDTVTIPRNLAKTMTLTNGGGTETNVLHTSCSQPLAAGDVYGSLTLVQVDGMGVGTDVVYTYEITNNSDVDIVSLTAIDNLLGPIPGAPASLAAGASVTLNDSAFITSTTTNMAIVDGITAGGQMCNGTSEATVTILQPPPCEVSGEGVLNLSSDTLKWELTNDGAFTATIDSVEISWPDENGVLKEVKLEGAKIFDTDTPGPSAVLGAGDWIDSLNKRQIQPGDKRTFEVKFQHNVSTIQGDYAITVNFEEGCSVTYENTGLPFTCTKPIDELSMIWDGTGEIGVRAWKGPVGSTLLFEQAGGITPGTEVTVSGYAGSPNDVSWEILSGGGVIGESQFHLSCSDNEMNAAEDCGKRQGDGKGNDSSLVNDWLLEGMVDADGPFDCSALP